MDETNFVGYLVMGLTTLGGFVAIIIKFIQPINDLRVVIQKLNDNIDMLKLHNDAQNKKIEKHDMDIDRLSDRVGKLETKVDLFHK